MSLGNRYTLQLNHLTGKKTDATELLLVEAKTQPDNKRAVVGNLTISNLFTRYCTMRFPSLSGITKQSGKQQFQTEDELQKNTQSINSVKRLSLFMSLMTSVSFTLFNVNII